MTDHLPECIYNGGNWHTLRPCICDRLRACEQRVQKNVIGAVSLGEIGKANAQAYDNGYSAGLSAARDAVAALPRWGKGPSDRDDALSAIDALRGDE